MKKLICFSICLMLVSVGFSVYAENKSGATSISLNGGYYSFEGNQDYKDNFTGGLRIGYNFTENWGTELFFYYVPSKYNLNDADNNFYFTGIEGLYHFMPENRFVPFLALGIGATHYSSDDTRLVPSKFAIDYGAGFKFFISDNIAFRADVRHVLPLGDSEKYGHNPDFIHNDLLATVGILFTAGWKEKVVDSDRDGVLDDVDKCPDTPLGVKVDKDGCPIDSDNDGVPDYLDKCPGTPVGCTVDKDGCPIDSDKDGVIDCRDKCPNTPEGCAVNKDGCPLDSDNDGVIDCRDKCPNTPAGAKVDKDGCSREKISISLNVQFDTAKADIKGKYHNNIKRVADFMKMYPNTSAIIEGHTDTVGKEAYNIRLSKARADSVKQYLVDKFGIDASSIETIGYGPKKPVADNSTPEGKQKNRRVDAVLETMLVR